MQIYQEVQKSFHSMGFSPNLEPFNRRFLSILVIISLGAISLWIFLVHNANSAQEYMESVYIVTISTGLLLSFVNTIFIKIKLFSFIKGHNDYLNDSSGNAASKTIYEKTNEFVEKWSKIGMFIFKYGIIPCFLFPKFTTSFFIYFTTDLDNDAFNLPVLLWIPFDWKNPIGYLMMILVEFYLAFYPSQYVGCFVCLTFGTFMFIITHIKILKNDLRSINKMARNKKSRKNMYKKLSEFIRRHADLKQLIFLFSDLYEVLLTITFVYCIVCICATMLLVQIEISHNGTDSMVLMEATVFGAVALIVLLFVCELGQRFSGSIDEIDKVINQFDWYLFPRKIKRLLPTVMLSAQQPVVIKCFGNVSCTRKQLRKVVKTAYSYFMTLRKIYK